MFTDDRNRDIIYTGETGCLVDGHWGVFAAERVIEIAADYGMELTDRDKAAVKVYFAMDYHDDDEQINAAEYVIGQGGLVDAAEQWLNDHVADENHSFGWHDGEFFYMPGEWWEESY